ncbi:hypothetical protein AB1E18_016396 [Capra hircus]
MLITRHDIRSHPVTSISPVLPSIRVFSNESALHISPGSQPRTQASNHSSPLLPGEMGGCTQTAAGHPVAFSADSSWEGPPRSAQPPGHHLDSQAWGSPTAIAAG